MSVAPNDVNLIAVETTDQEAQAGAPFDVRVTAEVGNALFGAGGEYRVRLTVTDTTVPGLLDSQQVVAHFGEADWPTSGRNVFTFTVPAAATAGKDGDIVELQARLLGNATAPFDASHVVGDSVLLIP